MARVPNRSRRRATYDDLLRVPNHLVARSRRVDPSPRPASPHARAATLTADLVARSPRAPGSPRPGGWWI